jgi:hypothetical protein
MEEVPNGPKGSPMADFQAAVWHLCKQLEQAEERANDFQQFIPPSSIL